MAAYSIQNSPNFNLSISAPDICLYESILTQSMSPYPLNNTLIHFMHSIAQHGMSSAECEHIRIVLPCSLYESRYSRISFTPSLSRPLKGSSRISIFGFSMIACASPKRCRIPRLYLRTWRFKSGSSPTCLMLFLISSLPILLLSPARSFKFL